MATQSPHLTDIPQAIRIAASTDAVDPALKQQALDYLTKVKELCEETWQVSGELGLSDGVEATRRRAHTFSKALAASHIDRRAFDMHKAEGSGACKADMTGLSLTLPPGSRCACCRAAGTRWQGEARRKLAHVLPAGCRYNLDEAVGSNLSIMGYVLTTDLMSCPRINSRPCTRLSSSLCRRNT